tara:strand:- start:5780 stop:5971 length:192 start_codon:yes stop_codon:yes gene_type:complete
MNDISDNLVYPTKEWDEIWEKLPNDLKILVSKELIDLNKKQKITFMKNFIKETKKELDKLELD